MMLVAQLAVGAAVVAVVLLGALKAESARLDRVDAAEQRAADEARAAAQG